MDEEGGGPHTAHRGIGASLRGLATGALGLVAAHVELLGVELQEEKQRVAELVVLGAVALVMFAMALLLGTLAIVVAMWEHYRLETVLVLTVVYAAIGVAAVFLMRGKIALHPNPFAATAEELHKDRERLGP